MKLKDKVAIVTGSSRGIGRAIALRLAKEGCKVVINYHEDSNGAEETQRAISKGSIIIQSDVRKVAECKKLIDKTIKKFGKIDILVNNAGLSHRKDLVDTTEEDWNNIMDTNLKSVFFLSKFASKYMENGVIINISSARTKKRRMGVEPYAASKVGVESITKTFAMEFAGKNIRVNAISPGGISSDPHHAKSGFAQNVPLKRLGEPEEVANLVAFLASDEASYITGTVIDIDGGFTVI